jgi:hypothetical protein
VLIFLVGDPSVSCAPVTQTVFIGTYEDGLKKKYFANNVDCCFYRFLNYGMTSTILSNGPAKHNPLMPGIPDMLETELNMPT